MMVVIPLFSAFRWDQEQRINSSHSKKKKKNSANSTAHLLFSIPKANSSSHHGDGASLSSLSLETWKNSVWCWTGLVKFRILRKAITIVHIVHSKDQGKKPFPMSPFFNWSVDISQIIRLSMSPDTVVWLGKTDVVVSSSFQTFDKFLAMFFTV